MTLGLPLGRLPGDFTFGGATSLLLPAGDVDPVSIVLTLLMMFSGRR